MKLTAYQVSVQSIRKKGFALVSSILIISMLMLIALAMLSLSSSSTKTASRGEAMAEAKANARLALLQALGRLQEQVGPDQRISANANILSMDTSGVKMKVANPHWTGVWDSWKAGEGLNSHHNTIGESGEMSPSYKQNRHDHFRGWLVSLDPSDVSQDRSQYVDLPVTLSLDGKLSPSADDTAIRLVGTGSLGDEDSSVKNFVNARLLSVSDSTRITGRYGWWVGDESQKARLMPDSYKDETLTAASKMFRAQAPGSMGIKSLDALAGITNEQLKKLPSLKTIDLNALSTDNSAKISQLNFHDATIYSKGVLADVREGGLKRDLSTILAQPINVDDVYNVESYFRYERASSMKPEANDYMLYSFNDMVTSSSPIGEANVPIQDLSAYYQLYNSYRPDWGESGIQYSSRESSPPNNLLSNGIMVSTPDYGLTHAENNKYLRAYNALYRQVIPVKLEYILHYVARPITPAPADPNADDYELKIGFSPAITLWNPNNVPMVMNFGNPEDNSLMIREHPLEMDITFKKSDSYEGAPTESRKLEFNRITHSQQGELYTVFISGEKPVVFQPGETKVFSLQVSSNTDPQAGMTDFDMALRGRVGRRYSEPFMSELELVPGWNPRKFLVPNTDAGGSRQEDTIFTFKQSDYISAEIAPGHGKSFSTDFAPKGRHGRNKSGVEWVFRSWRIGGRIVEGNQYQRSDFHRNAIKMGMPPLPGDLASTQERVFNLPAREARKLIDAMQNPTDISDDLPQAFFYYSMKAGVESHESNQALQSAGGGRRYPSRPFTHSSALSPPMIDKLTGQDMYTHGWNWFFTDLDNYLDAPISISSASNGYYGGGYTAENGTTHVVQQHLPLTPPISIAGLSHAQLGGFSLAVEAPWVYDRFPPSLIRVEGYRRTTASGFDGLAPRTLQAIGNSYAHPNIDQDKAVKQWGRLTGTGWNRRTDHPEPYVDHSYLANKALWDEFYFSSFIPKSSKITIFESSDLSVEEVAKQFFYEQKPLPNHRITPYSTKLAETKLDELLTTRDQYKDGFADKIAAYIMVEGAFNVNSTSEKAWKALFTSLKGQTVSYLDIDTSLTTGASLQEETPSGVPIGSSSLQNAKSFSGSPSDPQDINQWSGWREITDKEINELAAAMVKQVKQRGPFLSLSEFVNRRLDSNNKDFSLKGALQAAIDDPECSINAGFRNSLRQFSNKEKSFWDDFEPEAGLTHLDNSFPEAMEGAIAYGSQAYIDQADILRSFAAQLSPRGDTFIIRAYGDSLDSSGKVIARAWCEAVVQRTPDYLDPADANHINHQSLTSSTNREFGRKINLVKFRWLNSSDI